MTIKQDDRWTVTFNRNELVHAAMAGVLRYAENLCAKLPERFGADADRGWSLHCDGALAECAWATMVRRPWGPGVRGGKDVADWQVRSTRNASLGLCLHDSDADDDRFVLILATPPTYRAAGWLFAREGKRREHWRDPTGRNRPAYFVPVDRLRPMSTLGDAAGAATSPRLAPAPRGRETPF